MRRYVGAIDQGTSSTRFIVFNHSGSIVSSAQLPHKQYYPKPGWVEHDPIEILENTRTAISEVLTKANLSSSDLVAIGITNQRETTLVWEKATGKPVYNAIVWQDTRTAGICDDLANGYGQDRFRNKTGLPLSTYFSGPKLRWILENIEDADKRAKTSELLFGTIDTWLLWNLTRGIEGGLHITDVTNASRTMLMNIHTLDWEEEILDVLSIPKAILPEIKSSSEVYGMGKGVLEGVPIASILGDQQAALFGQTCFQPGDAKNTYGTGCFLLMNTGEKPKMSKSGLLTTVAYKLGSQNAVYALEGSVAITGALIQWLRDNLGIISSVEEIEGLAVSVEDNGGVYFVPAFSGLFAPHWRSDARGIIAGLTRHTTKAHIARAALEAVAYQTKDIIDAMNEDAGEPLDTLKVDGGMVYNELLMQFQADMLGVTVIRPSITETTSLGAAYAAGLAVGFWKDMEALRENWGIDKEWEPVMDASTRNVLYTGWKKAVERTFDWIT